MPRSKGAVRRRCRSTWFLGPLLATAAACSSTHPDPRAEAPASTGDVYHLGPLRVLLRPQPEVQFICRLHAYQRATPNGRILGCYLPEESTVISTPDPHVLLHELKHFFEGSFHD